MRAVSWSHLTEGTRKAADRFDSLNAIIEYQSIGEDSLIGTRINSKHGTENLRNVVAHVGITLESCMYLYVSERLAGIRHGHAGVADFI